MKYKSDNKPLSMSRSSSDRDEYMRQLHQKEPVFLGKDFSIKDQRKRNYDRIKYNIKPE